MPDTPLSPSGAQAGPAQPPHASPTPGGGDGLRWLYLVLGVLMLGGVGLNLANVIGRYVFGKPIFWAEEVLVGVVIWGVFFGAAVVSWRGDHLNMDLCSSWLGRRGRLLVNAFIAACMVFICLYVAWHSWTIVQMFHQTEAVSAGAQIPKVIPHAALTVGFLLSAVAVLLRWRVWLFGHAGGQG